MRSPDTVTGQSGIKAKFAREYDAWRGSALRAPEIEAAAARSGFQIVGSESLGKQSAGTQSRYYIFRKTGKHADLPAAKNRPLEKQSYPR